MPSNIFKKDPIIFFGIFVMKRCNGMSLSFTMLLVCMCLHIRTQAPVPVFTEFLLRSLLKCINVPVFV